MCVVGRSCVWCWAYLCVVLGVFVCGVGRICVSYWAYVVRLIGRVCICFGGGEMLYISAQLSHLHTVCETHWAYVCICLCVGICGVDLCVLCMHARMAFSMCVYVCVRTFSMCIHVCMHTHARGFKRSETYAYAVEECQKRPNR
jgi:hypothetical protein